MTDFDKICASVWKLLLSFAIAMFVTAGAAYYTENTIHEVTGQPEFHVDRLLLAAVLTYVFAKRLLVK